jgi:hypothetical protein
VTSAPLPSSFEVRKVTSIAPARGGREAAARGREPQVGPPSAVRFAVARTFLVTCHALKHEGGPRQAGLRPSSRVCLACSAEWARCRGAAAGPGGHLVRREEKTPGSACKACLRAARKGEANGVAAAALPSLRPAVCVRGSRTLPAVSRVSREWAALVYRVEAWSRACGRLTGDQQNEHVPPMLATVRTPAPAAAAG